MLGAFTKRTKKHKQGAMLGFNRLSAVCVLGFCLSPSLPKDDHAVGFATITKQELLENVSFLASPELEGRDTPSAGLTRAALYAADILKQAGFEDIPGATKDLLWTYRQEGAHSGRFAIPLPDKCSLSMNRLSDSSIDFEYGVDFVPIPGGGGTAKAEPIFLGFGIDSKKSKYNDLKGKAWKGKIAVILEGEPRHRKLFEGSTITREADLYRKIEELEKRGIKGVISIRRNPEVPKKRVVEPGPTNLSFRHSWASFAGLQAPQVRRFDIPALEITAAAAEKLFGQDLLEVAETIDKRGKPIRIELPDVELEMASATSTGSVDAQNVVAVLPGSDPDFADEYVVIGAHYDHLGVDPLGRIGTGADDNGTGVATILEVAQACGAAQPKRSVMVMLFAGEEDGLRGSRALCANLPIPAEQLVAMVNMDMLGRGERDSVLLLGISQNPSFEKLLKRGLKLKPTGIKNIITNRGQKLYQRSDHFAFHELGVPAIFFFEGWPISDNKEYHTFDDSVELLDMTKVWNTAKLIYNVTWLLANDETRPPKPR
ncbi:MAG: hypothetical protein ACI8TQ_000472 [Planctomycetota bacterium]|jgi:hypothetical protein